MFQENIPLYDIKIEPREDQLYFFKCTFVKDGIALSFQEKSDFFDRIKEIATKNHIPASLILLILDQMRDQESNVNALIYAAYTNLQQQIQSPVLLKQAFANLLSIKNHVLGFDYNTTCELRLSPQSVCWGYGNLVILKGKLPESVLTKLDRQVEDEVYGLQSLENGGHLYNMGLHEEDVLILAPRLIHGHSLEGLKNAKGYKNMFFYDELPTEYLDMLKVPEELRQATTISG